MSELRLLLVIPGAAAVMVLTRRTHVDPGIAIVIVADAISFVSVVLWFDFEPAPIALLIGESLSSDAAALPIFTVTVAAVEVRRIFVANPLLFSSLVQSLARWTQLCSVRSCPGYGRVYGIHQFGLPTAHVTRVQERGSDRSSMRCWKRSSSPTSTCNCASSLTISRIRVRTFGRPSLLV